MNRLATLAFGIYFYHGLLLRKMPIANQNKFVFYYCGCCIFRATFKHILKAG
jgi:hypothetical protein